MSHFFPARKALSQSKNCVASIQCKSMAPTIPNYGRFQQLGPLDDIFIYWPFPVPARSSLRSAAHAML
eukprot:5336205-Amphidinium_carterae.1